MCIPQKTVNKFSRRIMLAHNKIKNKEKTKKKNKRTEIKLVLLNEEELIQQVCMRPVIYDRSLKGYRKMWLRKQCWSDISRAMDATEEECRKRWRSLRDSFAKHYKVAQKGGNALANKQRKWVFYDKMSFLIPHIDGVSYDLDKILDELGDISEDGRSISSEPIGLNSVNEEMDQPDTSMENSKEIKENGVEFVENLQQNSVSVQVTDLMPIPTVNHSQSAPNHINDTNNGTICSTLSGHNHTCRNHNTCTSTTFCGEINGDNNGIIFDSDEKFLLSCAPTLRRLTHRQNALARLKIQQILFDIEFDQTSS